MEPSIAQYILRDGTIYFVLVAGLEFTNIISFSVGEKDQLSMVYFQPALQVAHGLIICRFILNLQKHNEQNSGRCMDSNASIRAGTVVLNQNCNRMDDIGGFLDWTGLNELDELDAEDDYLAGDLLDNLTRTSTNGLVMDSAEIQVVLRSSTST
ncbi:hypothetical protein PsYK624_003750 [Phanerochaete sordida]|uniref:Uncharacterized protein n=1 Tax=Phanerochaete sordida TaxID=48140 RepID=A0A9P3FXU2_9APHY|nr:hypothetical protein PsYK624_003750 [Phanerochaete sordida]